MRPMQCCMSLGIQLSDLFKVGWPQLLCAWSPLAHRVATDIAGKLREIERERDRERERERKRERERMEGLQKTLHRKV